MALRMTGTIPCNATGDCEERFRVHSVDGLAAQADLKAIGKTQRRQAAEGVLSP